MYDRRDQLPALDERVKEIKIKNPIVQHISGNSGVFSQLNIERQRTYNLPEWRQLCEATEHQPPARRGERRQGQVPRPAGKKRGRKPRNEVKAEEVEEPENIPTPDAEALDDDDEDAYIPGRDVDSKGRQPRKRMSAGSTDAQGRQPKRRGRRVTRYEDETDNTIWQGFNYRIDNASDWTQERCEELEKQYWSSITYNNPLYGADMPGSLFDDSTTSWNVAKLENLLDCLGQKLPGVNTAYLYLGMWKSTFAWHLEDVDLYSINYIHFGAPKQWYSISQKDAHKFEAVMKRKLSHKTVVPNNLVVF